MSRLLQERNMVNEAAERTRNELDLISTVTRDLLMKFNTTESDIL